ncbi:hypothetical protein [Mucilaginibacter dorajii]|uniref:Beta-carotene 15,15'-monooxygenase n=1 Tax=Mucilaginibacter dorajii TaxID=692994 RepID=A0ABP7QDU2_9SPHI|nr:hypothetical protein [Mucilaginibacter dorajii]MCS3733285.1 hypothetical protein [Mucilaginibacter dorajii]
MEVNIDRINYYNIFAMFAAASLALFIPFELVLLSYAILGPAHYLTEISWLNSRSYFTLKKYDIALVIGVVVLSLLFRRPYSSLVYYTFGLSFILLVIPGWPMRLLAFALLVITGYFLLSNNLLNTIFGLYIPTLIHVYIFTGAFLLLGALRQKGMSGYIAFLVFVICPVLLCVLFNNLHIEPTQWAIGNYQHFARLNTITLRNRNLNIYTDRTSIILTRLIAFAYTYHYINWFAKTRVINWHQISRLKGIVIVLIWAASITLYFYNYSLGIKWLLILSLAHVILEFPLNHRTFIGIGKEIRNKIIT